MFVDKDGFQFSLTVKEARSAIRKARNVYAGVKFLADGDQRQVRLAKAVALMYYAETNTADGELTTVMVGADGDVYIG